MMRSIAFTLLAAISLVNAATFTVMVGMNSTGQVATVYTPNQVTAQAGDIIEFQFRAKNHTVTQSSFANPCTQQFNTATNSAGVDSGFMPVGANATSIPVFSIQVNDATTPQWFFCNQANHCNSGMVFAINAPATGAKTFAAYQAKAANATHPDPALHQTAPFTPTPANTTAGTGASSAATGATGATSVPANAGAGVSSTATGTNTAATSTTRPNAGVKIEGSVSMVVGLIGLVAGVLAL